MQLLGGGEKRDCFAHGQKSNPELKKEGPMLHIATQSQHRLAMIKQLVRALLDLQVTALTKFLKHTTNGGKKKRQISCKKAITTC